jgi:hypothetical protein
MISREEIIEKYANLFEGKHGYPTVGNGWLPLIDTFLSIVAFEMERHNMPEVKIQCVKEKFGGLNIYFSGGNDYTYAYSSFAMKLSYTTCETCGTFHEVGYTTGWIKTICKSCHDKWNDSEAATIRGKREWAAINSGDPKIDFIKRNFNP